MARARIGESGGCSLRDVPTGQLGLDPAVALAINDADGCFEALGDSVISDSTYTNVNHFPYRASHHRLTRPCLSSRSSRTAASPDAFNN